MNKQKWTEKPMTWGGFFKLCGILTVIGMIVSAISCIALLEPTWWIGFRKATGKLFNSWARRKGRF